jgi:acyl-CoA thioester hydrolase
MERGRTEWLRARGIEQDRFILAYNTCFSLINTTVRFVRPARFNDELVVLTRAIRATGARVGFEQLVHRGDAAGELLCAADCSVACLTADTFKPRRLPPDLLLNLA